MATIKGIVSISDLTTGKILSVSENSVVAIEDYLQSLFVAAFNRSRFKLSTIRVVTGHPVESEIFDFPITDYEIDPTPGVGKFTVSVSIPIQFIKEVPVPGGTQLIPFTGQKMVRLEILEETSNVVFATNTDFLSGSDFLEVLPDMIVNINWNFILY